MLVALSLTGFSHSCCFYFQAAPLGWLRRVRLSTSLFTFHSAFYQMRERRFPGSLVALAAGLVSLVLLWFTYYHAPSSTTRILEPKQPPIAAPKSNNPHIEGWSFDTGRDSRNLGFTDEQCDVCDIKYLSQSAIDPKLSDRLS